MAWKGTRRGREHFLPSLGERHKCPYAVRDCTDINLSPAFGLLNILKIELTLLQPSYLLCLHSHPRFEVKSKIIRKF